MKKKQKRKKMQKKKTDQKLKFLPHCKDCKGRNFYYNVEKKEYLCKICNGKVI